MRQEFYDNFLTEVEHLYFTSREHGARVHPLVVQVDLSRHPEPETLDLLRRLMRQVNMVVLPRPVEPLQVLHAQQARYCFLFRNALVNHSTGGAIRLHLVDSMSETICGGCKLWENDIAAYTPGGSASLMGTLCSPTLRRWRPIEVD